MNEYLNILSIDRDCGKRWVKQFEKQYPKAVELKSMLQKTQKSISDIKRASFDAEMSIKHSQPEIIEALYNAGKISEERKDTLYNSYRNSVAIIAANESVINDTQKLEEQLKNELAPMVHEFIAKKDTFQNKPYIKAMKLIFGFLLGTAGYAVGFVLADVTFRLSNLFAILPKTIDLESANVTAAAIGANILAYVLFSVVDKNKYHGIAFSVWLIIIAAMYLALCLIGGDLNLVWYSGCSFIINGIMIANYIKNDGK